MEYSLFKLIEWLLARGATPGDSLGSSTQAWQLSLS
jgi:hypothetical protein